MSSSSRSVWRSRSRVRAGRQKTLKSSRPTGTWLQVRDNSAASDVAGRGTLNPPPLKWVLQEGFVSNVANVGQKVRPPNCLRAERHGEVCVRSWNPTTNHHHQDTTALTKNLPRKTQISRGKVQILSLFLILNIQIWQCFPTAVKQFPKHKITYKENWRKQNIKLVKEKKDSLEVRRITAYFLTWDPSDWHSEPSSILSPPGGGAYSHPSTRWVIAGGAAPCSPWQEVGPSAHSGVEGVSCQCSVVHPLPHQPQDSLRRFRLAATFFWSRDK